MEVQLALADGERHPEFQDNVAGVETRTFGETAANPRQARTTTGTATGKPYYLIGKGMGHAMVGLLTDERQ